jgi:Rrf2 family transcriptional regulator, nitric oxide-sensitive transcriptional repressor
MFSQTVEYALRAAVYLASAPGPRTVEAVSEATRVPAPYLAKVVRELVRAGLLRSQRGAGGGVSLAKDPASMTILEVVNAVDPIKRIKTCPLGLPSHGTLLCPLHARVDAALASVEEAFGKTTLAEVLAEPSSSIPLCDVRLDLGRPPARAGGRAAP